MNPQRLWAKSARRDEAEIEWMLLPRHLAAVHDAALQVLDATGEDQLRALGLKPSIYRDRLRRCVLLAAALHDLGKANDHFQGMICRLKDRSGRPQGVRHEWISVLLQERLKEWLLPAIANDETDFAIVGWAIGGHHPAYNRESPPRRRVPQGEGDKISVFVSHNDFKTCLQEMASRFAGLIDPPKFDETWNLPLIGAGLVFEKFEQWLAKASAAWELFTDEEKRLVAAVKLSLIAADIAGSALPRVKNAAKRLSWINDALSNTPKPGELADIVRLRLDAERAARNDPDIDLRQFQKDIGNSRAEVTFAKAGCGSGKTLAAYHWAATNHPEKRLYLCYPTTGTATEGFRDYLHNPDFTFKPRLFHGRADVDMALIVEGDEPDAEADGAARIESLDAWSTPVVSCTVDTVLGLVQNNRRGRYAWPALAGAGFVFDEIHAYDDRLFGALLRFLQNMPGVPVLLMTASLPKARFEALNNCLKRARREEMETVHGPDDLETLPRYHREDAPVDIAEWVRRELAAGGKVLWVSNTVDRAMAAADSIADLAPKIYHSRFRYCDRVERHKIVVDAFKTDCRDAVVACTTQVCEMSLDLAGVTLLMTELAPVPALIQRLGRLNRKAKLGDFTRPFIVIDVGNAHLPYTPADLQAAREWLADLPTGALSQRQLAEAWERHDAGKKPDYVASAWLDGGPVTTVLELREASQGITVVLYADARRVVNGEAKLAEVTLPMPSPPKALRWRDWDFIKGVPVAPEGSIEYDDSRGAAWQK
ncbi:MAG: CRISPR-associated helicase Cas3' [Planctomycetes bacterium]|nr:CRISPR-associated helicase Cas3' [Planctomycetota bacterium]